MEKLSYFNIRFLLLALVLLLGQQQFIFAGNRAGHREREEVSRVISEQYRVSSSDKLDIVNKYGKVHVNTWDKGEITVQVTLKAWDRNKERANDILSKIDVRYGKSGNTINFVTEIKGSINSNKDSGFEIAYVVNMPKNNPLAVDNKFGSVFIDDFKGELALHVKYGSFKGAKLTGVKKQVSVGYGSIDIDMIEKADMDISYGSLNIAEAEQITMNSKYSKASIDRVTRLDTETKYGSLEIESAESLYGSVAYSKFRLGHVKKNVVLNVNYIGDFTIEKVARGFDKIELIGNYSSFDLTFDEGAGFEFNVHTAYGSFKNSLANAAIKKQVEIKQDADYQGTVGKKADGSVKIVTRYGSVKFK